MKQCSKDHVILSLRAFRQARRLGDLRKPVPRRLWELVFLHLIPGIFIDIRPESVLHSICSRKPEFFLLHIQGIIAGINHIPPLISKCPVGPARRTVHKPPSIISELLSPTIREGVDIHGDLVFLGLTHRLRRSIRVDRQNIPRRIRLSVVVGVGKARVLIYPHASIRAERVCLSFYCADSFLVHLSVRVKPVPVSLILKPLDLRVPRGIIVVPVFAARTVVLPALGEGTVLVEMVTDVSHRLPPGLHDPISVKMIPLAIDVLPGAPGFAPI